MANWSQEMVRNANLFLIKLFLIAKFDCSIYSHKKVFYDLNIKRRCIKIRILLQNAFNPKVKFQLKVDLPSLPEDYPLSYTGKPSIIDHIFWLLKVFEKVRSRINHTANIYYGLLIGLL